MSSLRVVLETSSASLPTKASQGSAGYDLYACENCIIEPGTRKLVDTGLRITLPEGTYGRIASRSGLAYKSWIDVCAGVIDRDYTGVVKVLLHNHGNSNFNINVGDRIAQLIVERIADPLVQQVECIEETNRGSGGFGSTGL